MRELLEAPITPHSVHWRGRALDWLLRTAEFAYPLVILTALWEFSVQTGIISSQLFPAPSKVAHTLVRLLSPGKAGLTGYVLEGHILTSLKLLLAGVAIALVVGAALGLIMGISPLADQLLSPLLSLILPIPSLAWTPVLLISLGRGVATLITVIVLGSIAPVLHNTREGVRNITSQQIWAMRSMGASNLDVVFRLFLPGALGHMITGFRLGVAYGWRALVAAEMIAGAGAGIGFMIFNARTVMATDVMLCGVVMIALIGLIIEQVFFATLERVTIRRWGLVRE